jgi:hypothetical protein
MVENELRSSTLVTLLQLANSIPRGDPHQHEAVSESDPQDPEVPLPPSRLGRDG